MQTQDVARFLLTGMVTVLVVQQAWSNSVEYRACVERNGTICNRRPPEECNTENLQPLPGTRRLVINPETFFYVALFVNHSSTTRQLYLYLQWMQYGSLQSDSVTVRFTPLVQGRTLDHQVICLSNLGQTNETTPQIQLSDYTSNILRHSTLVPFPGNEITATVEISVNSNVWEYLVQTPKYGRHSWILRGVSITTRDNKGYISISSPDTHSISFIITLVCHLYSQTEHNQTVDQRTLKILSMSPVTNCSSTDKEIYLEYNTESAKPLVFAMSGLAYSVMIDAQLTTGFSKQVVGEAHVTTPIFVHVGAAGGMDNLFTQKPRLEVSTKPRLEVSTEPRLEGSMVQEVNRDNIMSASELSAVPSKTGETVTDESNNITMGISAASASLVLVVCLFVTWRFASRKCKSSDHQQQGTSDKPTLYENTNGKPENTETCGPGIGSSNRTPRFRSECCTNRVSDVPSNGDLSDPLISPPAASEDSLYLTYNLKNSQLPSHDILETEDSLYYDDSGRNYVRNNFFQNRDDAYQGRYNRQPRNLTTRKQNPRELDDAMLDGEDTTNTESQTNRDTFTVHSKNHISHYPLKLTSFNGRLPRVAADFKYGSNFMLNSRENSIWEGGDSDYEYFGQDVVKPEMFSDPIDPIRMKAEFLKINQEYEQLTGIAGNLHNSPSYDTVIEDECFSISESIVL